MLILPILLATDASAVWEICVLKGKSELEVKRVGLMGSETPKYILPSYSTRVANKRNTDGSLTKPPVPNAKSKNEALSRYKADGYL